MGTGTACASGFAEGDAFAVAMVDIFVQVTLSAIKDTFDDDLYKKVENALDKGTNVATGEAVGEAARAALASAWASAANSVCTTGEATAGFDEGSAVQVRQAVAFLFAEVILNVCKVSGAGKYCLLIEIKRIVNNDRTQYATWSTQRIVGCIG